MQLFYDPSLQTGLHTLREEEAAHAFRVLRRKQGDQLDLVDGRGGWYQATVASITKRECLVEAQLVKQETERAPNHTTLLVAPTKNIDRFEWMLEKATEIGIDCIQPVLTSHSERKSIRNDRLEKVIESAMKQSIVAWKPELGELLPLEEALLQTHLNARGFLAYLGEENTPLLHRTCEAGGRVYVAIGPEGGFSPEEAALAKSLDYEFVSLGPKRLRTETAAITAVHTIEQLNW